VDLLAVAGTHRAFDIGLVVTALGFGFRHGIDWDHIAALTDITSSQDEPRRSMVFASLYALGHAVVVFILGVGAIMLSEQLPDGVDTVMERVVGATLILLGLYVFASLLRHGRDFRMRSRWMLVFGGVRRGARWLRARRHPAGAEVVEVVEVVHDHEHPVSEPHRDPVHVHAAAAVTAGGSAAPAAVHRHGHRHLATMPADPFLDYGKGTAFGVGMIHGVGAETPTQVLIFLAAAGAGGRGVGLLLLMCFLVGLVASNTLIALAGTFGFLGATRNFPLYATVSVVTAVFSLVVGTLFLVGRSTVLPAFFGG
jgi:hypothetical protein